MFFILKMMCMMRGIDFKAARMIIVQILILTRFQKMWHMIIIRMIRITAKSLHDGMKQMTNVLNSATSV